MLWAKEMLHIRLLHTHMQALCEDIKMTHCAAIVISAGQCQVCTACARSHCSRIITPLTCASTGIVVVASSEIAAYYCGRCPIRCRIHGA